MFLLNEDALLERLSIVEETSHGQVTWSETAGLRQIFFNVDPNAMDLLRIVRGAYDKHPIAA